jgi:uncharacterized protein
MICNQLTRADKKIIETYLRFMPRHLSAYSFVQLTIWKRLYRIEWARINNTLCVFFKDRFGSFMNCEPLGKAVTASVVADAFGAMDSCNKNKSYSRIENVEEDRLGFYRSLGYQAVAKGGEYVYERASLAQLRGDSYKSKRADCNYFTRMFAARYVPYTTGCRQACLDLYDSWAQDRRATSKDNLYAGMLGDSRSCLEAVLEEDAFKDFSGRIVIIDNKVKAFTFGYELNPDTFCVLYEIADLSFKGISQYIFRQLCVEMTRYRYINGMDDSGLTRLAAVKRSYRPAHIVPSYIIQKPHA